MSPSVPHQYGPFGIETRPLPSFCGLPLLHQMDLRERVPYVALGHYRHDRACFLVPRVSFYATLTPSQLSLPRGRFLEEYACEVWQTLSIRSSFYYGNSPCQTLISLEPWYLNLNSRLQLSTHLQTQF